MRHFVKSFLIVFFLVSLFGLFSCSNSPGSSDSKIELKEDSLSLVTRNEAVDY